METLARVRDLGKRYHRRWVFRGVEFELAEGDALVVTGPNGSGKSTLLRVMAGLVPASEGRAWTAHRTVFSGSEQALYADLTGWEHLRFFGDLIGVRPDCGAMDRVGLAYAADLRAGEYSTGMKQRLRLAIAAQTRPRVLLLDEPTNGMDEDGRGLVRELAREQRERGALVVATNRTEDGELGELELALGA
jgi:ABC-type multidrug transport system ATPase subunit